MIKYFRYVAKRPAFIKRLQKDNRGAVLIITGLMIFTLVGVSGAGIDLAAQSLVQRKLQQSTDLAAVAAGAAGLHLGANNAQRRQTAARYFALNYPATFSNTTRPTPSITVTNAGITVAAQNISVPTTFAQFIGVTTLEASGRTVIGASSETSGNVYDMVLILDNSGSMAAEDVGVVGLSRSGAMQIAARNLANSLMADGNTENNRIAIVPYDHAVPGGPNANCSATNSNFASQVTADPLAFTDSLTSVTTAINASEAAGGTNSSAAFRYARDIAGFVPTMRSAVTDRNLIRAVVWITDGINFCFEEHPEWNTQTLDVCRQFKNDGIIVFTIAFGETVSTDATVNSLMRDCASGLVGADKDQFFFVAPDSVTLNTAFDSILTTVNSLRIAE